MTTVTSSEPHPSATHRRPTLGRRIAVSVGLLVFIAGVLCVGILTLHTRVTAALEATHADDLAAREALGLALAVREHYLHETHTVIQGDSGQVPHHRDWIHDIEERVDRLLPRVRASEHAALTQLRDTSRAIDEQYRNRLLPAALAGDNETVRVHQHESEQLLSAATEAADAIVEGLDARAETTRRRALELSRLTTILTIMGVILLGITATVVAIRLRLAVLTPLGRLASAARRFGAGEFKFRITEEELETSELSTLGGAFNRMAIELELREAELLRTERIATLGQLTAGIAHEINNPIAVIRGYLKTMIPGLSGPEHAELCEELHILDEEAAACQRIVEDLLSYARQPALEPVEVEVEALISSALRRFASASEASDPQARFEVEIEPHVLEVDGQRMQQVLANLLYNAVDASPSMTAPITIRGYMRAERYVIEVRDRGAGIPVSKRERVFEPFFSERRGGSGLGLAVSRGIIEAHGGRIHAVDPGDTPGACIVIELPLRAVRRS